MGDRKINSWMHNYIFSHLYPELMTPKDWTINTLSGMDLTSKLEWCKTKRDDINRRELSGDEKILAGEFIDWLDYQIKLLQHWLDTLPYWWALLGPDEWHYQAAEWGSYEYLL